MTFKAELKSDLGWKWDSGALDDSRLNYQKQLLDGNGANQADAVWHKEAVTVLSGANDTYDLTNLTRTVMGDTHSVNLLLVKAIQIVVTSTTGGKLVVGNAASNEWSEPFGADGDTVEVPIDSCLLLSNRRCGWEVDDSNKNLKLLASGGDVTYSIAIVGTITVTAGECSSSGL
jgi:hypothetical protein